MKIKNKLKKRKQFNWTFKNGTAVHSKNMSVVFNESKGKDFKIGFSISKKVGKAVVRNKTKRRLREIITSLDKNIANHKTIILVARPTIVECDFWQMKAEVETLFQKAGLMKELGKNF